MPKNINKLKIIAATSMTIFSLACVFVATIAWFSANRAVNGNGNGFEIGNEDGIIESVKLHELNKSGTGGYSFKSDPSVTYKAKNGGFTKEPSDYTSTSIGTYDSLVDQVYAVLYVIQLKEEAIKDRSTVTLQITTSTEEKDNLFHQKDDGTYDRLLNKEGNPMSAIVQFYSMSVMKTSIKYSGFGGTTGPSFKSFYSATGYKQTITDTLRLGTGTSLKTCLEVIVAYNNKNIEKLLDINETNETIWSLEYNTIGFKQDWRMSVL